MIVKSRERNWFMGMKDLRNDTDRADRRFTRRSLD